MDSTTQNKMRAELIAPCGMNCALCVSYQAKENDINRQGFHKSYCPGCRPRGKNCAFMKKRCALIGEGQVTFCFECASFPCERLVRLDKRYRTNYHLSMVDNLRFIRDTGMEAFLAAQTEAWRCPSCGGLITCHSGLCLHCQLETLKAKKTYRWDR